MNVEWISDLLESPPEKLEYQGVFFKPEPRPDWATKDWKPYKWLVAESWSNEYPVAVLGDGSSFHRPQLFWVPGMLKVSRNPRWNILWDAGIESHLAGSCRTGFWSPNWVMRPVSMLLELTPIRNMPYMPCNNCSWGPLRLDMPEDLNAAPVRQRPITKSIHYLGEEE